MQDFIESLNHIVINICQLLASLVILLGIIKAVLIYAKDMFYRERSITAIQESRLEIGHSFSLGLAFLIGGSILKTIVTPNWNDIGQLAATIAIRTTLNFFLTKDLDVAVRKVADAVEEKREEVEEKSVEEGSNKKVVIKY